MRSRGLLVIAAGLIAACDVPIEHFHRADAAAEVSVNSASELALAAYVKATNTGKGDNFGHSVALSSDGSTLAVGAFREASDGSIETNDAAMDAGAVYVYTQRDGAWRVQAYLKAAYPDRDDFFGNSVALSADGSTLAVGAFSEDGGTTGIGGNQNDETAPAAGAAYVFARSGETWSQQAYVKASNTRAEQGFGSSVALSGEGSTLAVGAYHENSSSPVDPTDTQADQAGAAYVFTRSGTAWSPQAYVKPQAPKSYDQFGVSIALSADGQTLAVGASREGLLTNVGQVYVFARSGAAWTEQRKLTGTTTGAVGAFGNSVALSGDGATLAVGASREDSVMSPDKPVSAGSVYVFARSGATWTRQAYLEAANPGNGDLFGEAVALSADGQHLAIGASFEDSRATGIDGDPADDTAPDAGAVYLFTRSAAGWSPEHYVKASNTGDGDRFGHSVALSREGSVLAVGAIAEASRATGIGGDQANNAAGDAGAVYVFHEPDQRANVPSSRP
jgi:hypothetical protein